MAETNHLKTPNDDTLRGTGKLGWGESGKLHGTMKRLVSTFDEDAVGHANTRKKKTVKCPRCNRKFRSNNGKVPEHKSYNAYDGVVMCSQVKQWGVLPTIVKKVESIIINEFEILPGDHVAFTMYPFNLGFVNPHELKEYIVKNLFLMDNDEIYIEFIGVEHKVPSSIFVKNFIKL